MGSSWSRRLVDTHDGVHVGVDTALLAGRSLFDAHLGHAALDGLGHAAELLHFLDVGPGLVGYLVREGLDVVGTCPGVDHAADVGLLLEVDLRVAGDTGAEVRRPVSYTHLTLPTIYSV